MLYDVVRVKSIPTGQKTQSTGNGQSDRKDRGIFCTTSSLKLTMVKNHHSQG
jgi:hypothetical protein